MDTSKLKQGWLRGIFVNELGEIWSSPNRRSNEWRRLKTYKNRGYELLKVWDRDLRKDVHLEVHRYVCWAYYGPPPAAAPVVRHLDNCPANNALANLRYGTVEENQEDQRRNRSAAQPAAIETEIFFLPAA